MEAQFDLVIRNGTIVDGSGEKSFTGDVAVRDGWIVEVGEVAGSGTSEIDANGLLVTPGFVDVHTHYDGQAVWADRLSPSSDHGITTVITGNCGIGFAPCRPEDRKALVRLMEGVEDIPAAVTDEGLTWNWETFPEFLNELENKKRDINIAAYIPHSPLRVYVMGERAIALEPATEEDLAEMRRLLREAIDVGAVGFGTSRLRTHRSSSGEHIPTYDSAAEELLSLGDVLRDAGTGVFQIVPDAGLKGYDHELELIARIASETKRPVTYTHAQSVEPLEALGKLDEVNRKEGTTVIGQVLPRPIGLMVGLTATANPFALCPSYEPLKNLPLAERVAELRKPEVRERLLNEPPTDPDFPLLAFSRSWERVFKLDEIPFYEPGKSESVAAQAEKAGRTPEDLMYDWLLEEDGRALFMVAIGNYADYNLDWIAPALRNDHIVPGLGDGGAHYGMICDASYTTHALSYWTRERKGERLSIEEIVHMLSRKTAELVGLNDRGLIAPGHRADLNIIDHARLRLHRPEIVSDLPAGGSRFRQGADGYVATIVNGEVIMREGVPQDSRPGMLVRGVQSPRQMAA